MHRTAALFAAPVSRALPRTHSGPAQILIHSLRPRPTAGMPIPRFAALLLCLALLCASATAQAAGQNLPRAISPAELAAMLAKPPTGLEIIDVRPAAEFADFTAPGAQNLDIQTLSADPAFLTGSAPLVLLDKDGTTAMALGGVLSQKSSRPILVLKGGMVAWWTERELGLVVRETPLPTAPQTPGAPASKNLPDAQGGTAVPGAPASPPANTSPGAPAPAPQPPANKNAGC